MSILKSKIKKLDNISKRLDILKESDELNNVSKNTAELDIHNESIFKVITNLIKLFLIAIKKKNRRSEDVILIAKYLRSLKEFFQFIKNSQTKNQLELITHIADVIQYEKYEKNEMLIRFGDRGDKFYIIIRGSVSIIIPKEINVKMSEIEYLNYLILLRINNELDLLSKVLVKNKNTYLFDDNEIDKLIKRKNKLSNDLQRKIYNYLNSKDDKELFENIKNLVKFDNQKSKGNLQISTAKYIQNTKPVFELEEEENKFERKKVILFEYYKITTLITGDKFGDIALSAYNRKRVATVITEEECHLGILDRKGYEDGLKEANEKEKWNYIKFFLSCQLFDSCNKSDFINSYYNFFVKTKVFMHQKIISEQTEPNSLYFIKSGEYLLSARISLLELEELIKSYGYKINLNPKYDELTKTSLNYQKFIMEKNLLKVAILKDMDILGLDNMIYKKKYLFDVECISESGKLFSLDSKFLDSMILKDYRIKLNKINYIERKTKILLERLILIRETKLTMFTAKYETDVSQETKKVIPPYKSSEIINRNPFKSSANLLLTYSNNNLQKTPSTKLFNEQSTNKYPISNFKRKNNFLLMTVDSQRELKINKENPKDNLTSSLTHHHTIKTDCSNFKKKTLLNQFYSNILNQNSMMNILTNSTINKSSRFNRNKIIMMNRDEHFTQTESNKINYFDPLASDDFNRHFDTINYYNCFNDSRTNKQNLYETELKNNSVKSNNNLQSKTFSKPRITINNKKIIYFNRKIFMRNSKNLLINK